MKIFAMCIFLSLCATHNAYATLLPVVTTDSPNQMAVSWQWDGSSPSVNEPSFANWYTNVTLTIDLSTSASGFIGHLHIEDPTDPFTPLAPLLILGNENSYGVLSDNHFSHLGVNYNFFFDRHIDPRSSTLTLAASTVPEPRTLYLMLIGTILLFVKSFAWRQTNSYNKGLKAIPSNASNSSVFLASMHARFGSL